MNDALQQSRSSAIFQRSIELASEAMQSSINNNQDFEYYHEVGGPELNQIRQLSGCAPTEAVDIERLKETCQTSLCYHKKYRTIDGSCNNLNKPWYGMAYTPFKRNLKPIYENSFNLPVGWSGVKKYNGFHVPSARTLSMGLLKEKPEKTTDDTRFTHMLMAWGQFVDHDLTLTPVSPASQRFNPNGRDIKCVDSCENALPCFPVKASEIYNDRFSSNKSPCMEFIRSAATCGTGYSGLFFNDIKIHEQINELTAFLDGSNVYGSGEEESARVRDSRFSRWNGLLLEGGRVKLLSGNMSKPMLPFDDPDRRPGSTVSNGGEPILPMDCRRNDFVETENDKNVECYSAFKLMK